MRPELTIFSCAKAFTGEFVHIQTLAIESWKALGARVLLVSDEEGVVEYATGLGVSATTNVRKNEFGTPLLDSVFEAGQRWADTEIVAYVNTDIILFSEFNQAVSVCAEQLPHFLLSGQRFDFDHNILAIDFSREAGLDIRRNADDYGKWMGVGGADYFCFRNGDLGAIPPFSIGRFRNDNYLMYRALERGLAFVDATAAVMALHQPHGYNHDPNEHGLEYNNMLVSQNGGVLGRLSDATHYLSADFQLHERMKA